ELFSKAAVNSNYSIAHVSLAKCYKNGYGVKQNENLAFKWYQKSAENENIIAQLYLGYCYEFGIGTEENKSQFIEWYQRAVSYFNNFNLFTIISCLLIFFILTFLYTKTISKWYRLGKGVGQSFNASLHFTEKDLEKKIKEAENGNEVAQYDLGLSYQCGICVEKDERKAFELYQKSAEQGYKDAQFQLGRSYDEGIGTNINKVNAFEWYKKSAEQNYNDAQNRLGYCYKNGGKV